MTVARPEVFEPPIPTRQVYAEAALAAAVSAASAG
jgi:hypothetical protein